jgi:hypothetical protein
MDLTKQIQLARTLITTGEKHENYNRVCNFADEYEAHITGEGIDKYLKRYTIRESETMFAQRLLLTNSINPAVTNSLMKPFYKISRNNSVIKKYDFNDGTLNERIAVMLNDFNGDKVDNTNGLDMWLNTRFVELTGADPNAFVVLEWDAVAPTETIKPRPFEVSANEAFNFEYKGQELQWLHVCAEITYNKKVGGKTKAIKGKKWTYYGQGWTICYEQIDEAFLREIEFAPAPTQAIEKIGGTTYLLTPYETKLNYVPAFRVGYMRDTKTKGKSYLNPFSPAMPYLRKALKVTSELDITMTAHAFPQKMQYVQKCEGVSATEPCDNGKCPTRSNATCTACNGTGFRTITTAQEAIYLPMPESKDEFLPLNDMLVYKSPPIDLVKFQQEYVQSLKQDTHLAVYNSNMFLAADPQFSKTATEIDSNMDGIYDAIEPYSEKFSKVWKFIVYTCAALGGFNLESDKYDLVHNFPSDPKLKTLTLLLADLKTVNESEAPSFTRDVINNDIAEIIYNGDDEGLKQYKVKHVFFPFNGKSSEEIAMLLSTQYVSEKTKILYSNFETMFTELERENKGFYGFKLDKQWELLNAKVEAYKEEILSSDPMTINFNSTGNNEAGDKTDGENPAGTDDAAPAGAGGTGGGEPSASVAEQGDKAPVTT